MTDRHPDPKIGPQVYLGPIKIDIMEDDENTIVIAILEVEHSRNG